MRHIVAAYTTSPVAGAWDERLEAAYYEGILAIPGLAGLEIPFTGALHAHDEGWLLRRLPAGSRHVVTCIPGTMGRLADNPVFGLASTDEAGWAAALDFARQARAAVARLNDAAGAACVMAVELHSAPSGHGSATALEHALVELAALDWHGAALVIEHCDALAETHAPQKGFLGLEEELAAIGRAVTAGGTRIGMSINWARSVLETRQAATGAAHVARVAQAGLLSGVMFSGCSPDGDQPYGAWQDNHMPHAALAPGSLLTEAEVAACLGVGTPEFVGVKVGARPAEMGLAQRIEVNRALMAVIRK